MGSCSPTETAEPQISEVYQGPADATWMLDEFMKRSTVEQAELVVQALETNFTTHPTVVSTHMGITDIEHELQRMRANTFSDRSVMTHRACIN